ncbi:MAG: hypothetical protein KDC01_11615 [Flavobacteriales bacterium]|nr:hypothetical protein [Flavobacteriales bacterium]
MKHITLITAVLALASCMSPEGRPENVAEKNDTTLRGTVAPIANAKPFHLRDLPNLEDNVRDDTLLIYTIHGLDDGTFVLAGKNMEDNREGLRLIQYRPRSDSTAEVLAVSKPAYDSEVMLPTFFTTDDTADGIIILANYGGLQSWGQNVFLLKDHRFTNLGWLDVAARGWRTRLDSLQQWRTNIAPQTWVSGADGQFEFSFTTDSVQLYDDLQGHLEAMFASDRIRYRYDGKRMILLVDGLPRFPKEPL